jgi:uncharacterized protein involved in outer membrane biogenesis
MTKRGGKRIAIFLGVPILVVVLLVLFWRWDWFIPIVESQASSAIGRKVTITHLHVRLGRTTRIVADDVIVANPDGFQADVPPLAKIAHLGILVDVMAYIHDRVISIPKIDIDQPVMEVRGLEDGSNNYTLKIKASAPPKPGTTPAPPPKIGRLTIENGTLHALVPKVKADFTAQISTHDAEGIVAKTGQTDEVVIDAKGTYAKHPITAKALTGALLTIADKTHPFPIDLKIANGATHVSLVGTVEDPLAFQGTDLDLMLSGTDMSDLYPLTGIPIPKTPAYKVTGKLNYVRASGRIHFDDFHGVVGNSDIGGTITEQPRDKKPDVTMDLRSNRVDLADLGGFIGTNPGRATTKNATAQQRATVAHANATSNNLLPTKPFNLPKLNAADIHLKYTGAHIEGRNVPLDSLIVTLDIVNGAIDLHPIIFTIGKGRVNGNISLTPEADKQIAAKADVKFEQVDVSRLMAATHAFQGGGAISGRAVIDSNGNSVATWMGNGNGGLTLYMSGGDLSALLVNLLGLEFGKAILSALGVPTRTNVACFIGDFALDHGIVNTRTLLLDTGEALVQGKGLVDLKSQRIDYQVQARSKNLSIGNLPTPFTITGTLKHPSIGVKLAPLAARGGLAVALGFIAAPLALLPTIELGVKDPNKCGQLVAQSATKSANGTPGAPSKAVPLRKLPVKKK